MIIGFTGTSSEISYTQGTALAKVVMHLEAKEAHHGDCVGADAAFDRICADLLITRHAHPGLGKPGKSSKRAYCGAEVIHTPLPYLERNRVIVNLSDVLIACPSGPERLRSGTWSTVRYARNVERPVYIVWPNGVVEHD